MFKLVEQEEAHSQQYRLDLPVYAYIRFSTMTQVKNSLQSKKMQDQRMNEKLVRIGFQDIRIKDKDEGISGQKGLEKRADLADIYRAMRAGECGAIAAHDASRLWRDRDRYHFNTFISEIKQYNVPVILSNKTYWPKIKEDMEALNVEFEYSQKYLEQFYNKVNPARQEAVLSGSFAGHCLPMGYVIVGEKGEKHYAVYEPHAKLVRWLYTRYQELDGNVGRLGRELVAKDFHFPDFDKDVLRQIGASVPHVGLLHDSKGYKLQSRGSIISTLTNRAYLGWYVYNAQSDESKVFQGEYVNKESHTAIVDYADFLYAYNRLSNVTLDGETNEQKPKVNRLYGDCQALLENILENNGAKFYAMARGQVYAARTFASDFKSNEIQVPILDLDRAVEDALKVLLIALEQRRKEGLQDSLHEQLTALQQKKQEETTTLDTDLVNVNAAIAGWELDKVSSREQGNKQGLDEANRRLKGLYTERDRLQSKGKKVESERQEIVKTRSLLRQAEANWNAMEFENKQRFVKLLVETINIQDVTPHILKIDILLKAPFSATMTGHMYRYHPGKPAWTDEEIDALKVLYPCADRAVILEALPVRSWLSIVSQANVLGVSRATRLNTSALENGMTIADKRYMDEYYLFPTKASVFQLPDTADAAIQAGKDHLSVTQKEEGLVVTRPGGITWDGV